MWRRGTEGRKLNPLAMPRFSLPAPGGALSLCVADFGSSGGVSGYVDGEEGTIFVILMLEGSLRNNMGWKES